MFGIVGSDKFNAIVIFSLKLWLKWFDILLKDYYNLKKYDDFLKNGFLKIGQSVTLFSLEKIIENVQYLLSYMNCVHCSGILTFWNVAWKLELLA